MKKFKILAAILAATTCLSGCAENGGINNIGQSIISSSTNSTNVDSTNSNTVEPKPTTTKELFEFCKNNFSDVKNGEFKGTTTLAITVTSAEQTFEFPVGIEYDTYWSKDNKAYTTVKLDADMPEELEQEDVHSKIKMYSQQNDNNIIEAWTQTDDSNWIYSTSDKSDINTIDIGNDMANFDFDWEMTEADDGWLITQTFESIFKSQAFNDVVSDVASDITSSTEDTEGSFNFSVDEILASIGSSLEDLQSQLGKGKISLKFEKDMYLPSSINITDTNYTFKYPMSDTISDVNIGSDFDTDMTSDTETFELPEIPDVTISISLSSSNSFTRYNELYDTDYTVPSDIVNNALNSYDTYNSTSEDNSVVDYPINNSNIDILIGPNIINTLT